MTRRIRRPLASVERSLRGLRWAGAVVAVAWMISDRGPSGFDGAIAMALPPLFLVAANLSSAVLSRRPTTPVILGQMTLDIAAVAVLVIVLHPSASSPVWAALALPVLEGALRFQFAGAVLSWLALAVPLFGDQIVRWRPGAGFDPFLGLGNRLAIALALGVVAGHLAANLAAELRLVADERAVAEHRARLLAVLTVVGEHLAAESAAGIPVLAVDAATELGFGQASLVLVDGESQRVVRSAPTGSVDVASAAALVGGGEVGSVENDGTLTVGVLARRNRRTMLLAGHTVGPDVARDDAFDMLVAYLTTALQTVAREREIEAAQARLRYDATHDQLTGLLNRAGLIEATSAAASSPGASTRLIGFIDLDGFKHVNDTLGHEAGDDVLREVARRLADRLPQGTLVARLGGDEFVVVTAEHPAFDEGDLAAEVGRCFTAPIETGAGPATVGGSIGLDRFDPDSDPGEQWRRADERMYEAKRSNRPVVPTLVP